MNVWVKKEHIMMMWVCLIPFSSSLGTMPLEHSLLHFLDGVTCALDGTTIWEMMLIRQGIHKIQYGTLDKETNAYKGSYFFQETFYSLKLLAAREAALKQEYNQKKNELDKHFIDDEAKADCVQELMEMEQVLEEKFQEECEEQLKVVERTLENDDAVVQEQLLLQESLYRSYQHELYSQEESIIQKYILNKDAYHDAFFRVQRDYEIVEQDLAEVFMRIKYDVLKVLAPFKQKMSLAKKFLEQLVGEFCRKHQRNKSFLVRWTMIADDQEFVIFNRAMTSCALLDEFCSDLRDFLKDVIESCPKGWQQFLELSKPKVGL